MSTHALAERETYTNDARRLLRVLEARLDDVVERVHDSQVWKALCSSDSSACLVRGVIREIMLEICAYQPLTTRAGFAMLGRLPKHETKLLTSLVHHKSEEAEHSEWAKRDFLLLGGTASRLIAAPSPASYAVIAVWDALAEYEDPFAYLGAEYLFECLTMRLAPELVSVLRTNGFPLGNIGFVVEHASEDVKHTNLIVHWILDVASRYPDRQDAIVRGFDYFAHVYPSAVWAAAFERALRETA
jgi:hypothetical protein